MILAVTLPRVSRCLLRLLASLLVALCLASRSVAQAPDVPLAEPKGTPASLVIQNHTFKQGDKQLPATLRNVVDAIAPRFPRATFTLVGTDDITIVDDVTLRWPRRNINSPDDPSPLGLLAALRAASRNRFNFEGFGPNEIVLTHNGWGAHPRAEVFKLAALASSQGFDPGLQRQVTEVEAEIAVLSKRLRGLHPQIVALNDKLELLKQRQAITGRISEQTAKLLEQIKDVVAETLQRLKVPGAPPDFKFHPGTGLLIVVGNEEALDITRKVVAALN